MAKVYDTVMSMTEKRKAHLYDLLDKWNTSAKYLAHFRKAEMDLRRMIRDEYFPNAREGVNTIELEFGKALKLDRTITRSVNDEELEALRKAQPEGSNILAIIDDLIKYKPSLSVSEWKSLDLDTQKLFVDVVTEKDGTPSVAIATPKK